MPETTIQIHAEGEWRDAAVVNFLEPERGIRGKTTVSYETDYFFDLDIFDFPDGSVRDRRAVSVRRPVDLTFETRDRWPAWLLDLMPQGAGRTRIAKELDMRPDAPELEIHLIMRAGGAPIGNLRIREAWEAEQRRLETIICPPLSDQDVEERSPLFTEVVSDYAHLASGSSGAQGEWPKALMTRSARDGMWYPDPFVPTDEGEEHMIVKLLKSTNDNDTLILRSEAPYLELARAFGLNAGAPLGFSNNVLRMPRFDREIVAGRVCLNGQESMVSALGVAEFGHIASHEDYLDVLRTHSDNPAEDILEYVLRDMLNLATGNPDNHGRNTALSKNHAGGVRLSKLFDYAPMRLSDAGIARVTNWACMRGAAPGASFDPICEAAACEGLASDRIREELISRLPLLEGIGKLAIQLGVPEPVTGIFTAERVLGPIRRMGG